MKTMMKKGGKTLKKMNSGREMKDGGVAMKKGGKCYAAGGAAKIRLKEMTPDGAPKKPKGKK